MREEADRPPEEEAARSAAPVVPGSRETEETGQTGQTGQAPRAGRDRDRGPAALAQAVRSPSFTPRQDEAGALLDLYLAASAAPDAPGALGALGAGGGVVPVSPADVVAALARIGPRAQQLAQARAEAAIGTPRVELVRLVGALAAKAAPDDAVIAWLVARAADTEPRAGRAAVIALGKLPIPDGAAAGIEAALLALIDQADRSQPADQRAIVEALGKLGGPASLTRLRAAGKVGDAVLAQAIERAALRLERTLSRPGTGDPAQPAPTLRGETPLPFPVELALRCRAGLTSVLLEELRDRRMLPMTARRSVEPGDALAAHRPGHVLLTHKGPLSTLFACRTFTEIAFPLPIMGPGASEDLAQDDGRPLPERVAALLTAPRTLAIMRALGPLRYRLHFAGGGHRRALVLEIAAAVRARCPELVNDPTQSPWQVEIDDRDGDGGLRVALVPKRLADPRFSYRVAAVPAASEPTLAAALARLCGARAEDVVWDPFAGSGAELIEVARLGACRNLYGSDRDAGALALLEQNLVAAGVRGVQLAQGDAVTGGAPPGLSCIVTNPPMGRRVRPGDGDGDGGLGGLLARFVTRAARILPPGGRLVWLTAEPRATAAIARAGGLRLVLSQAVDMNGFAAQLEVFQKERGAQGR